MTPNQTQLHAKMDRFQRTVLRELAGEVRHPVDEYTEDRVAQLVEQMAEAQRFPSPREYQVNV